MKKPYWNPMETAPLHEIRAMQSLGLSRTVRRVYENVPFYHKKFDEMGIRPDDIRSVDDLAKLPFTYKQDLRDNYPYGLLRRRWMKWYGFTPPPGPPGNRRWLDIPSTTSTCGRSAPPVP